ncbi:MAG: cytochrome d ubiquinol oxidase subunit II [Rhodospirillaceae bacterium]|nr:cytochrome d ubiquinol oxidase subunit II [Rhodospirillaceae bacterium]
MSAADLPVVWAAVIAFGVAMYVVMDGFDLGVGILFPWAPGHRERDLMMASVAPLWDGNETWLVLGGAGLLAAFPLAYAVILPAVYIPVVVMLVGLIFRGVAFEFRAKATRSRPWWDRAFHLGSLAAAVSQGVILGAFIRGFEVVDGRYAGGVFDWLTPFSAFCGLALACGYGLLGATWLILKGEGPLQAWAARVTPLLLLLVLAAIGFVSLWTPLMSPAIAARWFAWPRILYLWPVPLLTAVAAFGIGQGVRRGWERLPFLLSVALFLLAYLGLGISFFPHVIPPAIDIWEAASPPAAQGFLLWGAAAIIPAILAYTAYSYWVFRGKVRPGEGYH